MRSATLLCVLLAGACGAKSKPAEEPERERRVIVHEETIEILETIYFAADGATLPEDAELRLDAIASVLAANPAITLLEIHGHADAGEAGDLVQLSVDRADAVADYLIGKGIAESRLLQSGLGADVPAAPVEGEDQAGLNRRVDFAIPK